MVPMLDVILGDAADQGARKVMIGMAHRGRLNVLAHVVGRQLRGDPLRVRGGRAGVEAPTAPKGGSDDVKYHLGAEGAFLAADDSEVRDRPVAQPEPPRGGQPGHRGTHPRRADRSGPLDRRVDHATTLPDPHPRRRRLRGAGRRGRDAQPGAPGRLRHRRHRPPHRQQPGRLHDRTDARVARPTTPPTWPRASTRRSSTSTPTIPRPAWPPRAWR